MQPQLTARCKWTNTHELINKQQHHALQLLSSGNRDGSPLHPQLGEGLSNGLVHLRRHLRPVGSRPQQEVSDPLLHLAELLRRPSLRFLALAPTSGGAGAGAGATPAVRSSRPERLDRRGKRATRRLQHAPGVLERADELAGVAADQKHVLFCRRSVGCGWGGARKVCVLGLKKRRQKTQESIATRYRSRCPRQVGGGYRKKRAEKKKQHLKRVQKLELFRTAFREARYDINKTK